MADCGSDNPILDMGLLGMMQPNPYINPAYAGKPLKLPGFYTGQAGGNMPPTDAYGKPIQSFVDANAAKQAAYQTQLASFNANQTPPPGTTTLNTPPNVYGTANPDLSKGIYSAAPAGGYNLPMGQPIPLAQFAGGTGGGNQNQKDAAGLAALMGLNPQNLNGMGAVYGTPAAAPAPAPPPSPPDTRQDYLDALSNPGPPMKVGAAVPASQPLGVPSVMNAFMAAHPSGGAKGAGGYDNSGFFNTLSNLRSA